METTIPATISIDVEAVHDIAIGATLLGAGGGGETYLAELQLRQAIENGANIQLLHVADIPDSALIAACGWMGAPTVQKEKYANGSEAVRGLAILEEVMGRQIDAIFPIEIGGQNGLSPLLLAACRGIPVVDCDGMGRAFPEAHMVTFNIYGCRACPAVFTDEKGNSLVMRVTLRIMRKKGWGDKLPLPWAAIVMSSIIRFQRTAVKAACYPRYFKYCTRSWSRHQRS